MPTATRLASPFWVVLIIFASIRLFMGARGLPYEHPRVASVSLLVLLLVCATMTAALARGLAGIPLKLAAKTGALIGFYAQAVIFTLTMISIAAGLQTYFNYYAAIDDRLKGQAITIAMALPFRLGGLVAGPVLGTVAGSIGWLIGGVMNMNVGMMKK